MGLPICVKCLLGSMIGDEEISQDSLILDVGCCQFSSATSLSSSSSKARAQGSSPSTSSMVASHMRSHIDRFLGSLEIGGKFVCFVSREGGSCFLRQNGQIGGASRWRVCYKRGLHRLIFRQTEYISLYDSR